MRRRNFAHEASIADDVKFADEAILPTTQILLTA